MSEAIVLTNKQKTEITIMRHGNFYFHSIRINGRFKVEGGRVDRERALEIYENNQDDGAKPIRATGRINFDPAQECKWAWTVQRIEEVDLYVSAG